MLRVRWVQAKLEPYTHLVFDGFDQTPLWFTAAAAEKTLGVRGQRKVAVKDNQKKALYNLDLEKKGQSGFRERESKRESDLSKTWSLKTH